MQEFWFDYVKTKYEEKVNLYNVDTDTFIFYIKTEDTYIDIIKKLERRFDTSSYESGIPFTIGKN